MFCLNEKNLFHFQCGRRYVVESTFNSDHCELFTPFEKGGWRDLKILHVATILNLPLYTFFKG
jgi:hypothetical protein